MVSSTHVAISVSFILAFLFASGLGFISPIAGLGSGMSIIMAILPAICLMIYLASPKYGPDNAPDTSSVGPVPNYDVIDGLTINGIRPDSRTEGGLPPVPTPCSSIKEDCHKNPYCTHWEEWSMTPDMTKAWLRGTPHKDKVCVQKFGPYIPDECSGKYHAGTDKTGNVWKNGKLVTSQTRDNPGYIRKLCNSLDSKRTTVHIHPRLYSIAAKSGYPIDHGMLKQYHNTIINRFKCTGWCKFSEIMRWIDVALLFVLAPLTAASAGLSALDKVQMTQRYGATFANEAAKQASKFGRINTAAHVGFAGTAGVEIGGLVIDAKQTAATWRNFGNKIPISNLETQDYVDVANKRNASCGSYKKFQKIVSKPFSAFNHATYGDNATGTVRGPINIEYGPNPCADTTGEVVSGS